MHTVRRLLYREILGATGFVAAAFLGLFFFFDLVDEIDRIGRNGYSIGKALLVCLLQVPGHGAHSGRHRACRTLFTIFSGRHGWRACLPIDTSHDTPEGHHPGY